MPESSVCPMLYFICSKTVFGSIHRLPLCLTPSSESNLSRACRLYWFNRWLTSMIQFLRALKQFPCKGQPSHFCTLYWELSITYPLVVLSCLIPIRFMCCPIGRRNNPLPHCNGNFPYGMGWEYNGALSFMEVVVLDKGFYPILLHESVIFFRVVTEVWCVDSW